MLPLLVYPRFTHSHQMSLRQFRFMNRMVRAAGTRIGIGVVSVSSSPDIVGGVIVVSGTSGTSGITSDVLSAGMAVVVGFSGAGGQGCAGGGGMGCAGGGCTGGGWAGAGTRCIGG